MCAILLVRTAGPFSAQLEHLSYCELDLDYLDLLDFKLEQIRGHFCLSTTPMAVEKSGLGFALTQNIAEILQY